MKKIAVLAIALAMAFALAACAEGSLSVTSENNEVDAVAKGSAEGSATGNITIEEGYGLCINHTVEKGTFHVKVATTAGEVVFDEDITDNIANLVDVEPGEYDLVISANNAAGTINIIPYDKETQAQADAQLGEALEEAGVNAEIVEELTSSDASESN